MSYRFGVNLILAGKLLLDGRGPSGWHIGLAERSRNPHRLSFSLVDLDEPAERHRGKNTAYVRFTCRKEAGWYPLVSRLKRIEAAVVR